MTAHLVRVRAVAVVLTQGGERSLKGAAGAAKRGGLFLRDFIVERIGDRRRTAAERHHIQPDIVVALGIVSTAGDSALPVQRSPTSSALPSHDRNSGGGIEIAALPRL